MNEMNYITEIAPFTLEQHDYFLNWGRKRTMKIQRDTHYLAFAEKLIGVLPENREEWKTIIAQRVYDLVTPEEYIDHATRVRMLVEHDNPGYPDHPKITITCPEEHRLSFEQVNEAIKRLSKLAGLPFMENEIHPSVSIAGNAAGSTIITGNNSNVFRSHGLKGDTSGE